ncbi:D-2-hydroxyacid dehydrogenase [Halomarina oriensis]|uniref:D-2-hydroxyacid dehydrogenase n=1 Tax=Halomarina oriensis TaxID=671145 RepID=A0A6B0GNF4_9EURY|nr:D-2-hydroxyacid dehydrogenase [Halomarina oriensis]MWG33655.1 D-2-hydroxyacid dehydrogenase [Halomarina oriensis]
MDRLLLTHTVSRSAAADLREALADELPSVTLDCPRTEPDFLDALDDAEAVVAARFPADYLDDAPDLEWVQALSAGVDGYPREALAERDVALTTLSGVHAEPVAEQVVGYLLAFERGLLTGMQQQHRGVWERYPTGELMKKTLGIVGVGAIGTRVAELAGAFEMDLLGIKRDPSADPGVVDECFGPDGLAEVCERSDYLLVACPLTDETRGMVGREELRLLGEDGVLVNVARGEVVDQDALVSALQYHVIRGAALDVFETEPLPAASPLWDLSNVIVTPHVAGATPKYMERAAGIVAANYRTLYENGGTKAHLRNLAD